MKEEHTLYSKIGHHVTSALIGFILGSLFTAAWIGQLILEVT